VQSLILAFNDEVFSVRFAALAILGRLSIVNPACTVPALRKSLVCLLTDLEYAPSKCVLTSVTHAEIL
jgi:FKBP12-rapamycin complex-associated protein